VSALSFNGSPRCDLTLTKNVARPASILVRSNSTISRRISASGALASVARPPCPIYFLIAFSTDSLSHKMSTSSLSSACLRHRHGGARTPLLRQRRTLVCQVHDLETLLGVNVLNWDPGCGPRCQALHWTRNECLLLEYKD
jgi:hypothetical protein